MGQTTRRILRERTKVLRNKVIPWPLFYSNEQGFDAIYDGHIDNPLATKELYQWAICAQNFMAIREMPGRPQTIAHLGGGFCILPRLMGRNFTHTVYEREPEMAEWCPGFATFIPGDWQDTLTGTYDVIVYDIGGDVDRALLTPHLNQGGLLLGVD